jgi:hypothetical protein
MDCRDARELLDSFLAQELLVETNHELLRHLSGCVECKADLDARARLRTRLKEAFTRAADLQLRPEFVENATASLRAHALAPASSRRWPAMWAAAAAVLLVAIGAMYALRSRPADLATLAAGDHQNCAVKFALAEKPISLQEAAERYDSAYSTLRTSPPDVVQTAAGTLRVADRHSCVFDNRRFGHVVFRLDDHLISMLMTRDEGRRVSSSGSQPLSWLPTTRGLSMASFRTPDHVVYIVSDLRDSQFRDVAESLSQSKLAAFVPAFVPPTK